MGMDLHGVVPVDPHRHTWRRCPCRYRIRRRVDLRGIGVEQALVNRHSGRVVPGSDHRKLGGFDTRTCRTQSSAWEEVRTRNSP